jgi:hypothetical protein
VAFCYLPRTNNIMIGYYRIALAYTSLHDRIILIITIRIKELSMTFAKGDARINRAGRPLVVDAEKPTNKSLRQKGLMEMVRRFRPIQQKAIAAAVNILDNKDASEAGKLKSAALIISTYKDLLKDVYDYRYDADEAEEIQVTDNKPVFSLRMIKPTEE